MPELPARPDLVQLRQILDDRDVTRLAALLADQPALATAPMERWCDHPKGASPLGYVAMLRYDTSRGVWRDLAGTRAVAEALLTAGAPVNGEPGDPETPLITAASYGDAEVARALIEAGTHGPSAILRAYALPPGTPKSRVDVLRAAFDATMKDPEFLAEMKKSKLEINALTGGEVDGIVKKLFQMDAKTVAKIRDVLVPKN